MNRLASFPLLPANSELLHGAKLLQLIRERPHLFLQGVDGARQPGPNGKKLFKFRQELKTKQREEPRQDSHLDLLLRGLAVRHQTVIGAFQLSGSAVQLFVDFGMLLVHVAQDVQLLRQVL